MGYNNDNEIEFSRFVKEAEFFADAHRYLIQSLLKDPVCDYKHFYLMFLRYVSMRKFGFDASVISYLKTTKDQLDQLVIKILEVCNVQLKKLDYRLLKHMDEVAGNTLIILVSILGFSPAMMAVSLLNQDELFLFDKFLNKMMKNDGRCTRTWAIEQGRELQNSLSYAKTQELIDRLIAEKYLNQDNNHKYLEIAPRTACEMQQLLRRKFEAKSCVICQTIVIKVSRAAQCNKCFVLVHERCFESYKSMVDNQAINVSCPACTDGSMTEKIQSPPASQSQLLTQYSNMSDDNM